MTEEPQRREERPGGGARLNETTDASKTTHLQARGQLTRAHSLDEQADRLAAAGRWPDARRLRHEARHLRQLARGARPSTPVVDFGQLGRCA